VCKERKRYFDADNSACKACPSNGAVVVVVVSTLLALVVLALAMYGLQWRFTSCARALMKLPELAHQIGLVAKFKLTVAFVQVFVSIPDVYRVRVPPSLGGWMRSLEPAVFDFFEFYPPSCYGKYVQSLHFASLVPLGICAGLLLLGFARTMIKQRAQKRKSSLASETMQIAGYWGLLVLFCFAPGTSRAVFLPWACDSFEYSGNETRSFMRVDYSIQCSGADYEGIQGVATAYIFLWPLGVPLLFLTLLLLARKQITLRLRSSLADATRVLHGEYRKEVFWWEVVEYAKAIRTCHSIAVPLLIPVYESRLPGFCVGFCSQGCCFLSPKRTRRCACSAQC
jgi:hypothetical protein